MVGGLFLGKDKIKMNFQLSRNDIKLVHVLMGECREMWDDPSAWQRHAANAMERWIGGFCGFLAIFDANVATSVVLDASMGDANDSSAQRLFAELARNGAELWPGRAQVMHQLQVMGCASVRYREVVTCAEQDQFFARYLRPIAANDVLQAAATLPSGDRATLALSRGRADRAFTDRDRDLLLAFADALADTVGRQLTTRRQMGRHRLSLRQNQVLAAVLDGDSEKQISARLGISAPTVHEHVTALYRYFGAHSKGELMAYFIRRIPKAHVEQAKGVLAGATHVRRRSTRCNPD